MNLKDETPIVMITVGELKEVIKETQQISDNKSVSVKEKYVYGLKGIQELFSVSHATVQKYKDTILKNAISQQGRKIDTVMKSK